MCDPTKTLTRDQVVDVLRDAGLRAARSVNAYHPVDIAYAMVAAIENAAETLDLLRGAGHLAWESQP